MKKTLSLVLAVLMALSCFGVLASASSYSDVADTDDYAEAIEVMSAIGAIEGDGGKYNPDGILTREQAAKLIAYMVLTPTGAEAIGKVGVSSFTDVDAARWSAPFIEWCVAAGYIEGYGDGTFGPDAKLTTAAWTKLLLCALGYKSEVEDYSSSAWAINVASDAFDAGISTDEIPVSATREITRAEAAQLAFLTLTADMVEYEGGTVITMVTISTGAKRSEVKGSETANYDNVELGDGVMQLCEKYFPTLKLTDGTADEFGRPGHTWSFKGEEVVEASDAAKFSFTAATTEAALKKTIKGYFNAADDSIGSVDVSTNSINAFDTSTDASFAVDDLLGLIDNGVTVLVYATSAKVITDVVVIAPEFVQVEVTERAATKTKGAYTTYDVGTPDGVVFSTVVDADKDLDTAVVTGTVADEDMVLAFQSADYLYIDAVSTVKGICSAISSAGVYTIGGSKYEKAKAFEGTNIALTKTEGEYYVDEFGYILGVKAAEAEATVYASVISSKTVYILVDGEMVETHKTTVAYADGKVETIVTDKVYDDEDAATGVAVVTYDKDEEYYVLTASEDDKAISGLVTKDSQLKNNNANAILANASTLFVFFNYDKDDERTGTVTTYTGIANVPTVGNPAGATVIAYGIDTDAIADGIANVVFVTGQVTEAADDDFVYITGTYTQTGAKSYVYDAIIAGKETTVTLPGQLSKVEDADPAHVLYSVLAYTTASITTETVATADNDTIQNKGGLLFLDGVYDTTKIATDCPVYIFDTTDDTVTVKTFADITKEVAGDISLATGSSGAIVAVYVMPATVA